MIILVPPSKCCFLNVLNKLKLLVIPFQSNFYLDIALDDGVRTSDVLVENVI